MQITLGGLSFHSGDLPGSTGFTIARQDGWTGGAGSKRDQLAHVGGDGAFRTPSWRPDRMFTWSGLYHGSSLDEVQHVGDVLTGLEGLSLPVTVQWGETRWAQVEVDRVRFEPAGYKPQADYQVELWMPDPFKYGETREYVSTGSNVTIHNRGNAPVAPRFRVSAPWPGGYRIRGPLKADGVATSYAVVPAMTGSSVDLIDFAAGTITRNGNPLPRAVSSAERWTIPGGGSVAFRIEGIAGGTGAATAFVTDKYK